jgi:hypothetical protein
MVCMKIKNLLLCFLALSVLCAVSCRALKARDKNDKKVIVETWKIMDENGHIAFISVDGSGNFAGTGWTGEALGCGVYDMPISDGSMFLDGIDFKISVSYCDGDGSISGECRGTMNNSFPDAYSASGTCSGTFSDPLGSSSEFSFSWAGVKASGGTCEKERIGIGPIITESLTNQTFKITTSCAGPLYGLICFKGGNESQCSDDIRNTPSSSSIPVTGLTPDFAFDFSLPDGVEEVNFLFCDSATLSETVPLICSDGSEPQLKTVTTSPDSSGSGPPPDSTVIFIMMDACVDGQKTHIRFFDFENGWVWPSPTTYWIMEEQNQLYTLTLQCIKDSEICYGASSETNDKDWGMGLTGQGNCTGCCTICNGGTHSKSLTCQ